jgi:hypothetical protein
LLIRVGYPAIKNPASLERRDNAIKMADGDWTPSSGHRPKEAKLSTAARTGFSFGI